MHHSNRSAGSALVALVLLAGCASGGSRVVPPGGGVAGQNLPAGRYAPGTVFVSDVTFDTVHACPTGNIKGGFTVSASCATLQGVDNPVQVAVDQQGTVYVADAQTNTAEQGEIAVYPRGQTTPSRTLTTGLNTTTGVAVDSADTVYASNKYLGSIVEFKKNQSAPFATITANLTGPDGLAIDKADNLFIADGSGREVLELKHGRTTPQSLHLQGLLEPVGVAVDDRSNLYVSNLYGSRSNVEEYAAGQTKPKRTLVVPNIEGPSGGTPGQPLMLSIAAGDVVMVGAQTILVGGLYYDEVAGFGPLRTQVLWVAYGIGFGGAAFQPAQ